MSQAEKALEIYQKWLQAKKEKPDLRREDFASDIGENYNTLRKLIPWGRRQMADAANLRELQQEREVAPQDLSIMYGSLLEELDLAGFGDLSEMSESELLEADIEELIDITKRVQRIRERFDPILTHKTINIPTEGDKPIAIMLSGCFQIGGRYTWHEAIQHRLDIVLDLNRAYLGTFGDEIENFKSGSFAGERSVFDQVLPPPVQFKMWKAWMDLLGEKIVWGTSSQHGTMWNEKQGHNPIKDLYLDRRIPFFDGMFYTNIQVGSQDYWLAGAHEFPGNSMYNPLHPHKRALWQRFPNADILVQADKHQYMIGEQALYTQEVIAGNRVSPYVWMVQVGTAKTGADPYTIRGWERGFMEWPWMVLWPNEHVIKVTRHIGDVWCWLTDRPPAEMPEILKCLD